MVKVDLITGFLGSGKTTFIKKYAAWLMKKAEHRNPGERFRGSQCGYDAPSRPGGGKL